MARGGGIEGSGFDSGKVFGDEELGQPVVGPETELAPGAELAPDASDVAAHVEEPDNVTELRPRSETHNVVLSVALADVLERAAGWLRKLGGGA